MERNPDLNVQLKFKEVCKQIKYCEESIIYCRSKMLRDLLTGETSSAESAMRQYISALHRKLRWMGEPNIFGRLK